jgi:hypothetical protein
VIVPIGSEKVISHPASGETRVAFRDWNERTPPLNRIRQVRKPQVGFSHWRGPQAPGLHASFDHISPSRRDKISKYPEIIQINQKTSIPSEMRILFLNFNMTPSRRETTALHFLR